MRSSGRCQGILPSAPIAFQREVLEGEILEALAGGIQDHPRLRAAFAGELLARLLQMVGVKMQVAERVHKVTRAQSADLCHHHREQSVGGDVERNTEEEVGAPLVKLAAQLGVRNVKLEERMARRERHDRQVRGVPSGNQNATAVRLLTHEPHRFGDLVDHLTVRPLPTPPLRAVNRSKVTPLIRPFIPDCDSVIVQIFGVGVSAQKPQQLVDDRAQVDFLRRDQRKRAPEVEARLRTEKPDGSGPSAIGPGLAFPEDQIQQTMILLHGARK